MTFDKNNIEILIKYDNDDELTHAFSKENFKNFRDNVLINFEQSLRVVQSVS